MAVVNLGTGLDNETYMSRALQLTQALHYAEMHSNGFVKIDVTPKLLEKFFENAGIMSSVILAVKNVDRIGGKSTFLARMEPVSTKICEYVFFLNVHNGAILGEIGHQPVNEWVTG